MNEDLAKCSMCNSMVPAHLLDPRERECPSCRAEDRASDMTVGDLGGR